ncbi:MAG: hypothetical protein PHX30_04470 [Candidatus Pacebacteria bacterium]|jgi:hypothetical protein|nr:hypothetical protein [Candidatus Paceibacterota bacterium]
MIFLENKKTSERMPKDWSAAFYNRKQAEEIFNKSAETFIEELPVGIKGFLIAGAAIDFAINEMPVKSAEILEAAERMIPGIDFEPARLLILATNVAVIQGVDKTSLLGRLSDCVNAAYGGIKVTIR